MISINRRTIDRKRLSTVQDGEYFQYSGVVYLRAGDHADTSVRGMVVSPKESYGQICCFSAGQIIEAIFEHRMTIIDEK